MIRSPPVRRASAPTATHEVSRATVFLCAESPSETQRFLAQSKVRAAMGGALGLDRPLPAHPMWRAS